MSLRILIVDDEPHLPYQIGRFLKKHGYEVYCAGDGEAGLQEMQKRSIDLVLLDLRMPKMNGLEVLKEIRHTDQELPVIIMTANGDVKDAVTAMKLGASDYLLKGFDLDELLLV
ncbi:MAG TPA: response regulator, partial [Ktedonobacteraceae bacterium]|nr:response regulator [Ktedonobacteraceae bacterium]